MMKYPSLMLYAVWSALGLGVLTHMNAIHEVSFETPYQQLHSVINPPSPTTEVAPDPEQRKSDFVAGTKVLFEDAPAGELLGEFPSKWDLISGNSIEVLNFDEQQVIAYIRKGIITPLMEQPDFLPERFTIEMECYFHNRGNEGYYIEFNGKKISIRINKDGIKTRDGYERTQLDQMEGWRKVQLSFNKRAMKVYFEGERMVNWPRVKERPTRVQIRALSHSSKVEKYAMIRNIRIAEGAVPLYERLQTDGKIVTNDIHFDTNKASLKSNSTSVIADIVKLMQDYPQLRLSVEGHTDSDGTEEANLDLSQRRAESVKAEMVRQGIAADRLLTKGLGESQPIDDNSTPEGKAKNRRVEFVQLP
ncbi:MAG: OmpA family protein [Bacteroidota bacterium]